MPRVIALDPGSGVWKGSRMFGPSLNRLKTYLANPDPLAEVAGVIALVVAANQPFYPLYLHAIAGTAAAPAWLTLLVTPAFAAVPWLARKRSLAGRALLPVAGVVSTMVGAKLMGPGAAAEAFLLPCALLAAALFRPSERWAALALLAVVALAYFAFDPALGAPICVFTPEQATSIARLNGVSVAGLLAFIGFQLSGVFARAEAPAPGA